MSGVGVLVVEGIIDRGGVLVCCLRRVRDAGLSAWRAEHGRQVQPGEDPMCAVGPDVGGRGRAVPKLLCLD